jgi:[FeFe] hydrogenase H-cluster maturation GTPase HydF
MIFDGMDYAAEEEWLEMLKKANVPVIPLVGKADVDAASALGRVAMVKQQLDLEPLLISANTGVGMEAVRKAIAEAIPEDYKRRKILGDLVADGELVLLVMPQDIQAPKGRLILPQVQTIRELLDNRCTTVCTTADRFDQAVKYLAKPPALIITDSQCFKQIYEQKPAESELTSFSVLFAAYKGDIHEFAAGAAAIDALTENSRVLIAEACTHAPLEEDIGRVKIPAMLQKKCGCKLQFTFISGLSELPPHEQLSDYALALQCGGCMVTRRQLANRIRRVVAAGVPVTNYGMCIAYVTGIFHRATALF